MGSWMRIDNGIEVIVAENHGGNELTQDLQMDNEFKMVEYSNVNWFGHVTMITRVC